MTRAKPIAVIPGATCKYLDDPFCDDPKMGECGETAARYVAHIPYCGAHADLMERRDAKEARPIVKPQ